MSDGPYGAFFLAASGELVEAERGSLKQDFYSYQAWL